MKNNVQDWEPVIWKKKEINSKKEFKHIDPVALKLNRIDNKTIEDKLDIITVSKEDANIISKLRTDKKISQQDLATSLNIKRDIIKDIERGVYPENKLLVNKIKKFLVKSS